MCRHRRRRSVGAIARTIVACVATSLGMLPSAAGAAGVAANDGVITYSGDALEANGVTVSRVGTNLVFAETSAAGITPTPPCSEGSTSASASCPVGTAPLLNIQLGERDDVL